MIIYIHDKNFVKVKTISTASSVVWLKKAREEGQCAFTIPITADLIPHIRIDNYISRLDDDMVCQIKKINIKTKEDTGENVYEVIGIDKLSILSQRVTLELKNYENKNVEDLIRELITENCINPTDGKRKLNVVLSGKVGFTDVITTKIDRGTNIFAKIKELCVAYDYCLKMIRVNNEWTINLYRGNNYSFEQQANAFIEFSDKFHNLKTTNYSCDKSSFSNTAVSETEIINDGYEGEERYEVSVGSATEDEAKNQLQNLLETFTGEIINTNLYKYKVDYNVGDIVTIRNNLGIQVSARIVQINEAYDVNGSSITPSFESRIIGG